MSNASQFYKKEITKQKAILSRLNKELALLGTLRLAVFVATALGIYFFYTQAIVAGAIALIGIVSFLYLLVKCEAQAYKKQKCKALIAINKTELQVLKREFQHLPTGDEFKDEQHAYSQDIDLFGKASFFQYLNRTSLKEGKQQLATWLIENNTAEVVEKQEAIQEMSSRVLWRQDFSAEASLLETEVSSYKVAQDLKHYKAFVPKHMKYLVSLISTISIVVLALAFYEKLTFWQVFAWFMVGVSITVLKLKQINNLSRQISKAQSLFQQYHKLLQKIEDASFTAKHLIKKQKQIATEHKKASDILREFSKLLDALDQRNNILISIPANGFFLRDLSISLKIEAWIAANHHKVEQWFEVVAYFDAVNSMGNFAYNHSKYTFPKINDGSSQIEAANLGHPLLYEEERIDNDFRIENTQFFIITGANMAGKSTFLRTVSLSLVMANIGLPVCASSYSFSPIKLITSMRTTDSLSNHESYFFSELKRLRSIVSAISKDQYFIILDEILKGTNSTDKAKGSRQFVEKLVASHSTGIIATHDLSLCEIEKQILEIKNYYFDAEIVNDELFFDYQLKIGVCKNMNASFLLKKMGIV